MGAAAPAATALNCTRYAIPPTGCMVVATGLPPTFLPLAPAAPRGSAPLPRALGLAPAAGSAFCARLWRRRCPTSCLSLPAVAIHQRRGDGRTQGRSDMDGWANDTYRWLPTDQLAIQRHSTSRDANATSLPPGRLRCQRAMTPILFSRSKRSPQQKDAPPVILQRAHILYTFVAFFRTPRCRATLHLRYRAAPRLLYGAPHPTLPHVYYNVHFDALRYPIYLPPLRRPLLYAFATWARGAGTPDVCRMRWPRSRVRVPVGPCPLNAFAFILQFRRLPGVAPSRMRL